VKAEDYKETSLFWGSKGVQIKTLGPLREQPEIKKTDEINERRIDLF